MTREKKKLERGTLGIPQFPAQLPGDAEGLLDLMDDAAEYASAGEGAGAPKYDHGMRLFTQINAHYQIRVARELANAHEGLKRATNLLKVATWWLAAVTVVLGAVEVFKMLRGH